MRINLIRSVHDGLIIIRDGENIKEVIVELQEEN